MGLASYNARPGIISHPQIAGARHALHTGREPLLERSYSSPPTPPPPPTPPQKIAQWGYLCIQSCLAGHYQHSGDLPLLFLRDSGAPQEPSLTPSCLFAFSFKGTQFSWHGNLGLSGVDKFTKSESETDFFSPFFSFVACLIKDFLSDFLLFSCLFFPRSSTWWHSFCSCWSPCVSSNVGGREFLTVLVAVLCLSVWFWDTVQFQEVFLSHRSFLVNSDATKTLF